MVTNAQIIALTMLKRNINSFEEKLSIVCDKDPLSIKNLGTYIIPNTPRGICNK